MADLVVRGPGPDDRWSRPLPATPVKLGRETSRSEWVAPWDPQISKWHATLTWRGGRLEVQRAPRSRNPIFVNGQALDHFTIKAGESFVIGETTFTVEETPSDAPPDSAGSIHVGADMPPPDSELTCSPGELRSLRYPDADERIEVLAALPEVIRYSPSDEELESRVVEVLLRGIPRAEAAAVVRLQNNDGAPNVHVQGAVVRGEVTGQLQASCRLIQDAISRFRQSVLHRWDGSGSTPSDYTVQSACNWAICTPLPDDPSPGWGLYVTGRAEGGAAPEGTARADLLKGDLKFAEVVADIFGSLRQVRDLQRRHAQLTRFLSQAVVAVLMQKDNIDEVLRPRETDVTVLFCDLRGFSRFSEEGQADLPGLWERVSEALGIMTNSISEQDGVIGDFQGDAAMGFWGWPLAIPDQVERAARAALNIRKRFARAALEPDHPLAGFACGIGIAHGRAIAGKLGTVDQFKVGVFGPVVNLASRLESMTKRFGVPVLIDEATAAGLDAGSNSHWCRCRRLAAVRPYGMSAQLTVSELLPSAAEPGALPERCRRDSEAALEAFRAGRWDDAASLLRRLPPQDGGRKFLEAFMERHQGRPPSGWDGVVVLEGK
jgi:adenylate cyclase